MNDLNSSHEQWEPQGRRDPVSQDAAASPGTVPPGLAENQPNPTRVLTLLQALPPTTFAFLTAPNARDYLTILYVLYWNTRWRSPELQHEDLFAQVNTIVRNLALDPLTDAEFNRLSIQLSDWGLIGRQVTVAPNAREWRINLHQYWLKDDAYNLLLALEELEARKRRRPTWTKGRDHIRALADGLDNVVTKLVEAGRPGRLTEATELRRQGYSDVQQLHDRDLADFKAFLSDINKDLLDLGRTPNLDFERIQLLVDRLEAFVLQTLRFFQLRGEEILQRVHVLGNDHLQSLIEGHLVERAAYEENARVPATDDTHPSPTTHLRDFRNYFALDGGLDAQSRRIQLSASLTTQRLREYYQALTQRGRTRELLDQRIQELTTHPAEIDSEQVERWLAKIAPVPAAQFAPGIGTPERRGTPQLPGRRYPYHRSQITETEPETPTQDLNSVLKQLLQRAQVINDFVETRLLIGRTEAHFHDAHIRDLQDFKRLLNAVRHDPNISGTPLARFFSFTIHDPRGSPLDPLDIIHWKGTDGAHYTGVDLTVRRKKMKTLTPPALEANL